LGSSLFRHFWGLLAETRKSVVDAKAANKQRPFKISQAYTKRTLLSELADRINLNKKDVAKVLEQLNVIIGGHLKKDGPGKFMLFALVDPGQTFVCKTDILLAC